jgi:cytochrome P450
MSIAFDPFAADWREDPYPMYRKLRDEAPVHFSPERNVFSVTRFDDVMHVLKSPELFSSRAMFTMLIAGGHERPPLTWNAARFIAKLFWRTRLNPLKFATSRNLIAEDGERHTEMRAIVNRGFTPRRIAAWEPRAREIVAASIAKLRRGEPFDVVADLAVPLPVTIIAEMLGVPRENLADFKRWSDIIVEFATGPGRDDPFAPRFADAISGLMRYMLDLARERRAHPADDVLSAIVAEQQGEAALTDREVVQFVTLLLVAGNETTTNLIGNLTNALLDHPDVLRRVAADTSQVPALIEEGLRFDTPVQVVFRTVVRDTELRGVAIPRGAYVAAFIGSANRDERRFPDPDRFDPGRDVQGFPSFGFGKHFCLGASLARLEARVAFEALAPELPRRVRAEGRIAHVDSFLVRGPKRLELLRAA